ncbi:hypothetical protein GIB67_004245 [Kingdonia uniflora]|uniref:Uncharacterized protein n=1 Tax=Kingdonia uniflora TaxID=39325 RepID=A0A7J7MDQ5_9MAGN|nr:hypothetical protein GIB67_003931 [Kingdonia uniflora]KAF6157307.1 hypothetical protein GIB67_004245 [Kingdonia uniflora]
MTTCHILQVQYLENDNLLLENKQKELKGTIDSMLQSRESFLSLYEDSTCEMRRSIEIRDRKIALLSENIHNHLLLFDSIGREAASVKQVVDNVQRVKALLLKEEVIENLTAEKKALHFDVRRFEIILQKIQNAYLNMDAEDKKIFSSALEGQKECGAMDEKENDRTASAIQESREDSIYKDTEQGAAENTGSITRDFRYAVSIESEECNSAANQPKEEFISNPQSATGLNVYVDGNKVSDNQDNCTPLINNHLDSESSTTEAASENPGERNMYDDVTQGNCFTTSHLKTKLDFVLLYFVSASEL